MVTYSHIPISVNLYLINMLKNFLPTGFVESLGEVITPSVVSVSE